MDEVVARYIAGEGIKKLAREYGVHRNTIWRNATRLGYLPPSGAAVPHE